MGYSWGRREGATASHLMSLSQRSQSCFGESWRNSGKNGGTDIWRVEVGCSAQLLSSPPEDDDSQGCNKACSQEVAQEAGRLSWMVLGSQLFLQ